MQQGCERDGEREWQSRACVSCRVVYHGPIVCSVLEPSGDGAWTWESDLGRDAEWRYPSFQLSVAQVFGGGPATIYSNKREKKSFPRAKECAQPRTPRSLLPPPAPPRTHTSTRPRPHEPARSPGARRHWRRARAPPRDRPALRLHSLSAKEPYAPPQRTYAINRAASLASHPSDKYHHNALERYAHQ